MKFFEIYKGYRLCCDPNVSEDGKFLAKLVIQKDTRSMMEEMEVGVKPREFNSEEEAAHAARIAGRLWVDDNG